jgi:hypothetical protein
MHLDILNDNQKALHPLLSMFKREYYLVGGTAIALQNTYKLKKPCEIHKALILL